MLKSTSSIYFMAIIVWWGLKLGIVIGIGSWVGMNGDGMKGGERRAGMREADGVEVMSDGEVEAYMHDAQIYFLVIRLSHRSQL